MTWTEQALTLLRRVRGVLLAEGYTVTEPEWEKCTDDLRWDMVVNPDGEGSAVISITAPVEEDYEGDEPERQLGMSFRFDVVKYGGEIVGELSPFNYTDEVWVPRNDAAALQERFDLLVSADYPTVPELLQEHGVMPTGPEATPGG